MRQYVIDELRTTDFKRIKTALNDKFSSSILDGIYRVPVKKEMLTDIQRRHVECQPFYFAIRLEENLLACEFLLRTKNRIRCECMGYATETQRSWLIRHIDAIFDGLDIKV